MKKVKICGIRTERDVEIINRYRPDAIGFIVNYPKSFRSVDEKQLRLLSSRTGPGIEKIGVFVNEEPSVIVRLLKEKIIDAAQLHGSEDEEQIVQIQKAGPVIKAFIIRHPEDLEPAKNSPADLVLLDAGKGSGKQFDWSMLDSIHRPYILAGGIQPDNLEQALKTDCCMIDLSSATESDGLKSEGKIRTILESVRNSATEE